MEKYLYRYPGITPFSREQRNVFFGRDKDIQNLKNLILIRNQVLLYAKSGVGKTSLLNAGVLPIIEDKYKPIQIRFTAYTKDSKISPVQNVINKLKSKKNTQPNILDILTENTDYSKTLWFYFKQSQLQNKEKNYILVFDQFEELFSYPEEQVNEFKEQLSQIIKTETPDDVFELISQKPELEEHKDIDDLYEEVKVKIVYAIRSDKLNLLNHLSDKISNIQRDFYELKPLTDKQAIQAIISPAKENNPSFLADSFEFEKQAITRIIDTLSDKENKNIETTQLQIVCQRIEEIVSEKQKNTLDKKTIIVTQNDLPKFKDIFFSFYENAVNQTDEVENSHIFIEDHLIRNGQRISLDERICKDFISEANLRKLTNSHLLRAEPNSTGGFNFELSHDTLVEPILESKNERLKEEKEKQKTIENKRKLNTELTKKFVKNKKIIRNSAVLFIIIVLIILWMFYDNSNELAISLGVLFISIITLVIFSLLGTLAFRTNKFIKTIANSDIELNFTQSPPTRIIKTKTLKIRTFATILVLCVMALLLAINSKKQSELKQILEITNQKKGIVEIDNPKLLKQEYIEAYLGSVDSLKINFKSIKSTAFIEYFKNLTYLDLSHNDIRIIPKEIGKLKKLTYLDVQCCAIESIPQEVWKLTNLTYLNLSTNGLKEIKGIGKLKKLTHLSFDINHIEVDNEEIGNLTNLIHLDLGLFIEKIPSSIFDLKNLNSQSWLSFGKSLYWGNNFNDAFKCFLKAIEIDKKSSEAFFQAGKVYNIHNDSAKAKEYFEQAIKLKKDKIRIKVDYRDFEKLCIYNIYAGKPQGAIDIAIKKIENDSEENFNRFLALAYVLNNEFDKAKSIYLKYKDKEYYNFDFFYNVSVNSVKDLNQKGSQLIHNIKTGTDLSKETPYSYFFIDDIDDLEEVGITHPDFEKVRELLK